MANRLHGKIAQLSREWRDVVNLMLRDGATYAQIREKVNSHAEEHGVTLNDQNLTNWTRPAIPPSDPGGGYPRWLAEQTKLEEMRQRREFALQVVKDNEGSQIHEAGMQIAASQIYELLTDFDVDALKASLASDPANFARIVNAMSKLSDSGLKYERYREEVKQRKTRMQSELEKAKKKGGITPETLELIEHELKLL